MTAADLDHFRMNVAVASLLAGLELPGGRGVAAMLPYGVIRTASDLRGTTDAGPGDVELRLRQNLTKLLGLGSGWPRLTVALGGVAPTGGYVSKQALWSAAPVTRYLSLGRGAWWLLGDVEFTGSVTDRGRWFVAAASRVAVTTPSDGFAWGSELRPSIGAAWSALDGRLEASVALDGLLRAEATEVTLFGERAPAPNGGGRWLDLTPGLRVQWATQWTTAVSARLPVWRDVLGVQNVQTLAVFVTTTWSGLLGATDAAPELERRSAIRAPTRLSRSERPFAPLPRVERFRELGNPRSKQKGANKID